jgi:small subunit ribosomal protein S21
VGGKGMSGAEAILRTVWILFGFRCVCREGRLSSCESHLGGFGGVFPLAEVRVQEGEPLENALRRFKRKVQTEDIIKEVKRHSFYLKPGEKKRVKEALARKRNRKKVRKEQD